MLALLKGCTFSAPAKMNAGPEPVPGVKPKEDVAIVFKVIAGDADQCSVVHDLEFQFQVFGPETVTIREIDDDLFKFLEGRSTANFKRIYRIRHPIVVRDPSVQWLYSLSTYRVFYNE